MAVVELQCTYNNFIIIIAIHILCSRPAVTQRPVASYYYKYGRSWLVGHMQAHAASVSGRMYYIILYIPQWNVEFPRYMTNYTRVKACRICFAHYIHLLSNSIIINYSSVRYTLLRCATVASCEQCCAGSAAQPH